MLCSFSSISSHTTFKMLLNAFKDSVKQVFVLVSYVHVQCIYCKPNESYECINM